MLSIVLCSEYYTTQVCIIISNNEGLYKYKLLAEETIFYTEILTRKVDLRTFSWVKQVKTNAYQIFVSKEERYLIFLHGRM